MPCHGAMVQASKEEIGRRRLGERHVQEETLMCRSLLRLQLQQFHRKTGVRQTVSLFSILLLHFFFLKESLFHFGIQGARSVLTSVHTLCRRVPAKRNVVFGDRSVHTIS
uniref:Uncharacterized protein n=1 Tax=Oryza brachyantha TaxID=4533 RepID=J3L2L1_ORYBR